MLRDGGVHAIGSDAQKRSVADARFEVQERAPQVLVGGQQLQAAVKAGYSEDIYEKLRNSDPDNGALSLGISNTELVEVLGEIGGSDDKTGLETLTTSMLLQCRNENTEYLYSV